MTVSVQKARRHRDLGTGYSSLSCLRKLPFDRIKIDRPFIHDMTAHEDSLAIVRAVSALGRSLGNGDDRRGREDRRAIGARQVGGCTEVQGFLFGAPRRAAGSTPKFCGADATACRPSPALLDRETDGEALNKHRNAPRTDASAAANRVAAIFDASFR